MVLTADFKSRLLAIFAAALLAACSSPAATTDSDSDESAAPGNRNSSFREALSYREALQVWRTPEDLNAWIGATFRYDRMRAAALSETRRTGSGHPAIYEPREFFDNPYGVCVDLSRFAVETLRQIDPDSKPNYLMIEFEPAQIDGNTMRMHWLASFRRAGRHYFFADSKRPGHIAGPYAEIGEFINAYADYRGRQIIAYRALESFQRKQRSPFLNKKP